MSSLGGRRTSINICGSRSFEQQTSDYLLVGTVGVVPTLALAESCGRQSVGVLCGARKLEFDIWVKWVGLLTGNSDCDCVVADNLQESILGWNQNLQSSF